MKKLKKLLLCISIFVALCVMFFAALNTSNSAYASIDGLSANNYILTGYAGNKPFHYFNDNYGNSTLENCKIEQEDGQKFYTIVPEFLITGKSASGIAYVNLTSDIIAMINNGVVYASASATVDAKNDNEQSRIVISLILGDNVYQQTSPSGKGTHNITTDRVKIPEGITQIGFKFEIYKSATAVSRPNFSLIEPTIHLDTIIDEDKLFLNNENAQVNPGDVIRISAENGISNLQTVGNFVNYSKINHAITYDVVAGSEYVSIIGDYIYFDDDITDGTVISIVAKCRQNSYNNDYIYSKQVDYTVSTDGVYLKINTDFENPATIWGEGKYYNGEKAVLQVVVNPGYNFKGWYINNSKEPVSTSTLYIYTVNTNDTVYAKFTKTISILGIQAEDKIYDGTNTIDNYITVFDGVESQHKVYLDNITVSYGNPNVGNNKTIIIEGLPTLAGKDKDLYVLAKNIVPTSYGNICKRDVYITAMPQTKQYGDVDPILTYTVDNMVEGESLSGALIRESGESVGKYEINLGTLQADNYNVKFDTTSKVYLTIEKRDIYLNNITVLPKEYNGNNIANVTAEIVNKIEDDDVSFVLIASYSSINAGNVLINIDNVYLIGEDKDSYNLLPINNDIYGTILQKNIDVIADNITVTYGEEKELTYNVVGLVEGDRLTGNLSREANNNVGEYNISLGTLNNPNYIINYTGATYTIVKRLIDVTADSIVKEYKDSDPFLTYTTSNMIDGDELYGVLSRQPGESVGVYEIQLGTLYNINYEINFITNSFEIVKRTVTFLITLQDKIYDGNTTIKYICSSQNLPQSSNLQYFANYNTLDANVGENKEVVTTNQQIIGDDLEYYNIIINYVNETVKIDRKDLIVQIDKISKTYGDIDPVISFDLLGLLDGESCIGLPKRNIGENVGEYSYYLDDLNNTNNPNYNIILDAENFVIKPKDIALIIYAQEKYYGDIDQEYDVVLANGYSLCFDDTLQDILVGNVTRQPGEFVGIYKFESNLKTNANYNLISVEENYLTISKRPITIIAQNAAKVYGEEDPDFVYEVSNALENDPIVFVLKRTYGENVGDYQITYTTLNDARYNITFVPATFTIIPSDITVKAESKIKTYGDEDPYYDVSIVSGLLKNNDVLSMIVEGTMTRAEGEDIGEYQILQGTFSLGKNYNITFLTDYLTIVPLNIQITATNMQKSYGNVDPELEYQITEGKLQYNDNFEGALSREEGEDVGSYKITIGTLSINGNYNVTFVPSQLNILPRDVIIIPKATDKYYGEEDPIITYDVIGELVGEDKLEGELYRDKPTTTQNPLLYENVGEYRIYCSLNDSNYNVIFDEYYFTIMPRVVVIEAESYEITYGQSEPELEYHIVSGDILDGDQLTGDIYRVPGTNAGIYDIRSSLTLGRNYKIEFKKGTFTINPIEIIIESQNYTKIYGEIDPIFDYQIVEGALINNETLMGGISRELGEDVGNYKLISTLSNINYNVTLRDAYLTILPKDAYLLASVHDKVYDGAKTAYIKTSVVTGLIDEGITLSYDKEKSAYFVSADVNYDIPVVFYNITLVGEKAHNYTLVLPTNVVGNITYNTISSQDVSLSTDTNTTLQYGMTVKSLTFDVDKETLGLNKMSVITGYNIWIEKDGKQTNLTNTVTLKMALPKKYANRNNVYVYRKGNDGEYYLVSSQNINGEVVITTDVLGEFVIMTDNDSWIDVGSYICIGILTVSLLCFVLSVLKKKKQEKNANE